MKIRIKRVYDPPADDDGLRVLVDRLWPRGLSKDKARVDRWAKDLAPSPELRQWFNHEAAKWVEFKRRYGQELAEHEDDLRELLGAAGKGPLTLLFGARDEQHNNAVALSEYLERLRRK
ncbi:MAG TPA: DUF488 domain-containing protein [Phycisphaerae bacterium]|nr:DUF488 domain-containing protein [Phycisphaerae bacterium]HOJ74851.1 DUF488 domain-containing protein [Phycisphaerae bacterium]HOM52014.1 DUF488 domain-containing protein [Phycisphaerae bacterium]HON66578.1 DUF488 domain-containing protein [Phycisphaerae bacterium]HOQ86478.1 DUF488 domain-containing protein [Phycisphaerae bacterium]